MKTVFDICLNRYHDNGENFSINTALLTWNLKIRKHALTADVEFALTLTSPNTLVPSAKFCIESTDNINSLAADLASSLFHNRSLTNVATFEGTQNLCRTAVNMKRGDELRIQLPSGEDFRENSWVRCTIELKENVNHEFEQSFPSPTIALQLFNDAVSSEPKLFADVILTTADNRKFHVHSCFLAKQSTVFNVMLQNENFKEGKDRQIKTPDVNAATMEEILRYIYTERINLDPLKVMAPEILYATQKYHLPAALKVQCCQAMLDSMTVTNALTFLITADMYSLDELKRRAIRMVVDNLNQVRKQDEWHEILKKQPNLVDEIFAFTASCLNLK